MPIEEFFLTAMVIYMIIISDCNIFFIFLREIFKKLQK